jgi:hypothetical protein
MCLQYTQSHPYCADAVVIRFKFNTIQKMRGNQIQRKYKKGGNKITIEVNEIETEEK